MSSQSVQTKPIASCRVIAYWLREGGQRLDAQRIKATARDCWLWVGLDSFRGPTPLARLGHDAAAACSVREPAIDALDHAEILHQRLDGVLVRGYTLDLGHTLAWTQRRQAWWCVYA